MKKSLTKTNKEMPYYYYKNGKCIEGAPAGITGDISSCEITEEERNKGIDINNLTI